MINVNVLIICAHPDDEIIGMGGTIKRLSKNNTIKVVFISDGVMGRRQPGFKNSPEYRIKEKHISQLQKEVEIRKNHAKEALKVVGVNDIDFYDFPNQELDQVPLLKIIKKLEKELQRTKYDIIFTHHYNDLNQDHRITYEATITAARPLPSSTVSAIISFEIPGSTDWKIPYQFKPNLFVDISLELKYKLRAFKKYHFELRNPPHPRSNNMIQVAASKWGSLSASKYAEAFEIIRARINKKNNSLIHFD